MLEPALAACGFGAPTSGTPWWMLSEAAAFRDLPQLPTWELRGWKRQRALPGVET